jgi:hypothetical protein
MSPEEYDIQMREAKFNLRNQLRENLEDRVRLNSLSLFLLNHAEDFKLLGLGMEWGVMFNRVDIYLSGLNREGTCLEEMEKIFNL